RGALSTRSLPDALPIFEPLDHELILLTRRKPGPHRLPGPAGPDPAVFGLGDADQAFLRHRVDRMVVHLIAPLKLPGDGVLAWEGDRKSTRLNSSHDQIW